MNTIIYKDITWQDYLKKFENYNTKSPYIFRGQSNSIERDKKFIDWKLTSSFNRYYFEYNFSFFTFVNQHLEASLFKRYYSDYIAVSKTPLHDKFNALQKLYFLQHYQIPTCLIDFTFDPLIALYFSISSIKGFSGSQYDGLGNPLVYPKDCYMSVYQINHEILTEFGIKNVIDVNGTFLYDNASYIFEKKESPILALDLNPTAPSEIYNLEKQKGCFLLFDNRNNNQTLEDYLESEIKFRTKDFKEPVIVVYKINWYTIYRNMLTVEPSLFSCLKEKGICGKELFDDLQGLKYDLNFFYG